METRSKFSREFKPEAVKMVKGSGVAAKQASRDLELVPGDTVNLSKVKSPSPT